MSSGNRGKRNLISAVKNIEIAPYNAEQKSLKM